MSEGKQAQDEDRREGDRRKQVGEKRPPEEERRKIDRRGPAQS
jgi:hypothetical protein